MKEKLLKGICPECEKELDYIEEYHMIKCQECNFKMSKREMDDITKN